MANDTEEYHYYAHVISYKAQLLIIDTKIHLTYNWSIRSSI